MSIGKPAKPNGPVACRRYTDVGTMRQNIQPPDQILPQIPIDKEP